METERIIAAPRARRQVAGYVRVSRIGGRQGDSYISVEVQKERILNYAEALGLDVIDWYQDEDFSGGNIERPAFMELIEECRAGRIGGVVVAALDRFSRDMVDGVGLAKEILRSRAVFASVREAMDFRDDIGEYMLGTFFNNAALQLNQIKSGWETAKGRAVARGAFIGPTPFGYDRIPKDAAVDSGKLVPNPVTGPIVRECFERRNNGNTFSEITRYLDEVMPRPNGWSSGYVKKMLGRRVYLGEIHYRALGPDREPLINLHAHKPIVSHGLFAAIDGMMVYGDRRVAKEKFLLSGIIRCGHCRYAMGGFAHSGTNRDTRVYRCTGRKRCPVRPIMVAGPLEEYVTAEFWRAVDIAAQEVEEAGEQNGEDLLVHDHAVTEAEAHVQRLTRMMGVLDEREWEREMGLAVEHRRNVRGARAAAYARKDHLAARQAIGNPSDVELHDLLTGAMRHVFIWKHKRNTPISERVAIVGVDDDRKIVIPSRSEHGPFDALDQAKVGSGASLL